MKRPLRSHPAGGTGTGRGGARHREASRSQMRAFFDNSPDWLTLFRATKDGRFIYEDLNRATAHAYGLSPDQVIGRALAITGIDRPTKATLRPCCQASSTASLMR